MTGNFLFFSLIRPGSALVSSKSASPPPPLPLFFQQTENFSGPLSLKKTFVDRHKFCQPKWGRLNITARALKPGFHMILPIALVLSSNVERRSGRLYGNTTQTIANDSGDWDDLDRLERTEFYDWGDPDDNVEKGLKTEGEGTERRHHRLNRDQGMREVTSPVPMREVSSSRPDQQDSTNAFHFT